MELMTALRTFFKEVRNVCKNTCTLKCYTSKKIEKYVFIVVMLKNARLTIYLIERFKEIRSSGGHNNSMLI